MRKGVEQIVVKRLCGPKVLFPLSYCKKKRHVRNVNPSTKGIPHN